MLPLKFMHPDCLELIKSYGLVSIYLTTDDSVSIYNGNGLLLFKVSRTILPSDFKTILEYGKEQYKVGVRHTGMNLQYHLKSLLNESF